MLEASRRVLYLTTCTSGLIARIAAWQSVRAENGTFRYYHHWLGALEDVLASKGSVLRYQITARADMLARRPAGHDHDADSHMHPH